MSLNAQLAWLKTGSILLIGFGLLCFLSLFTPVAAIGRGLIDFVIWPIDGAQSFSATETRLLLAIGGGLMVGWGEMLWLVTTLVYRNDPALGRKLILPAILAWFVIDSAGSVLAGVGLNAILNVSFLVIFGMPLLAARRETVSAAS